MPFIYHFKWYIYGMRTTIDRAGRIVIPKALRDRAGLQPGTELDVRLLDGLLEISVSAAPGRLVHEKGVLVWDPGPDAPEFDVLEAVKQVREEREARIMGLETAD
jgi:AbrB family looped-hinge helix DNA binding protein